MAEVTLKVGDRAPEFRLNDATGKPVSLADYFGKAIVVYFYPKAGTPGCTTEACDFRDNLNAFAARGYQVIGISGDSQEEIAEFADEQTLNFPLLSDPDHSVARAYGSYGDKTFNGQTFTGTLRSTAVVDSDGLIQSIEYDVDADGHVARLREELGLG